MSDGWCELCRSRVRRQKRHARICPVIVRRNQLRHEPYFELDVNAGSTLESPEASEDEFETTVAKLSDVSRRSGLRIFMKEAVPELTLQNLTKEYIELSLNCRKTERSSKVAIPVNPAHHTQYAAIVAAMQINGLVSELGSRVDTPVYVEFGAGRGYLSHLLCDIFEQVDVVLIERRSYRFKAERSLRQQSNGLVKRITIDIKDVVLGAIDELKGRPVVGFGKHLCGSATDLALRACFSPCSRQTLAHEMRGFAVATCCHHRCSWNAYVNKPYLVQLGFNESDFRHLTRISSWATLARADDCHDGASRGSIRRIGEPSCEKLTVHEKISLGRLAKRIIDSGRLYWCSKYDFRAKMITYTDEDVSTENVVLLIQK